MAYTNLGNGTYRDDSGKLFTYGEESSDWGYSEINDPTTGFQAFAPGFSAPDSYEAVSRARNITNDPRLGRVMGTRGDDNEYYAYSRPSYDDNGNLVGGSPRPSYDDNGNLTSGIRPPSYDDNGNVVGAIQPTPASMNYNGGQPLIRYDPDYWTKEMFYGGLDSLEPYRQQGLNNIVKIDGQYYVPKAVYDQSQAAMFPYSNKANESGFDKFMEGLFQNGPIIASAAFLGPAIAGAMGGAGAGLGAGLAEGTAAGLAGAGESIMAGGYGANLAASGAGFGAGATGLSLAELGAGSLLGGGAGSVLAGGAGALGLSAETVAAMQALGYSGAEIASMGGNVLNGFDAMQAAASGAAPFDISKYLPSKESLVKNLIQQGLKLANSDGSSRSAGGLPNYSGSSTSSGGVSGALPSASSLFPDSPTGGANPIKSYLQPTGVSTGAPSQSTMYAGLDPKLVNILSRMG